MTDPPSPLDILLSVMRERFQSKDYDGAVAIAKAVAPFVHPKPNARAGGGGSLDTLRDHQLVELCRSSVARTGAAPEAAGKPGSVVPVRTG